MTATRWRTVVTVTIDGDPASKSRTRFNNRSSRVREFRPERTHAAEGHVAWAVRAAARGLEADAESAFSVTCEFVPRTWQRRDIDNMLKLVLDGLNGVVWADDYQVTEIVGRKLPVDPAFPRTIITIRKGLLPQREMVACARCGREVRKYRSQPDRRFCSNECRNTRTACVRGHDWSDPRAYYIRADGRRYCAVCKSERERAKRRQDREAALGAVSWPGLEPA